LRLGEKFHADYVAAKAKGDPFVPLRAAFEANARAGLLSPDVSLVLSYVLCGSDAEYCRFLLSSMLLFLPAGDRVPTHNWLLSQHMDSGVRHAHGAAIERLHVPLWPPEAAGADALNAKLLRGATTEPAGSGHLAEPLLGDLAHDAAPRGAGFLPVTDATGATVGAVEVSPVERACDDLRQQIQQLQRRLSEIERPATRQQQPRGQQQYPPQQTRDRGRQQQQQLPSQQQPRQQPPATNSRRSRQRQQQTVSGYGVDDPFDALMPSSWVAQQPPAQPQQPTQIAAPPHPQSLLPPPPPPRMPGF
jgi:hypothetical protein